MHIVILNSCNSSLYFIQKQITKIFSIIKNSTVYMPYTEISLSMLFFFSVNHYFEKAYQHCKFRVRYSCFDKMSLLYMLYQVLPVEKLC